MAGITHKHAQDAVIERNEARIARGVAFRQQLRAQAALVGNPLSGSIGNGFYNDDDEFEQYLRLDVDAFNSGKGCAP